MSELADRLRGALAQLDAVSEKRMFGGICFLWREHMLAGTGKPGAVMFRVGKDKHAEAVGRPGAAPMVHGGRQMEGFVWVDGEALGGKALGEWIALANDYISTLPDKPAKPAPSKRKARGQ